MIATYISGLIQTKAQRILHFHMSNVLEEYDLSLPEWTLIGLLAKTKEGFRLSDIAIKLDVEPPFATNLVDQLEEKEWVIKKEEAVDHRAKRIIITSKGKLLLPTIEGLVKERMKKLFKGVWYPEVVTYMNVLKAVIANDQRLTKGG